MGDLLYLKPKKSKKRVHSSNNADVLVLNRYNSSQSISIKLNQNQPVFDPFDYIDNKSYSSMFKSICIACYELVTESITKFFNSIPYFFELTILSGFIAFCFGCFKFVSIIMNP